MEGSALEEGSAQGESYWIYKAGMILASRKDYFVLKRPNANTATTTCRSDYEISVCLLLLDF